MNLLSVIVPIQGDTNVSFAILFSSDLIVFFQGCLVMYPIFFADTLDTGIAQYKRELNGALIALPKAMNQPVLAVAMLVESFSKELIG